jgi:hypothetical protein
VWAILTDLQEGAVGDQNQSMPGVGKVTDLRGPGWGLAI